MSVQIVSVVNNSSFSIEKFGSFLNQSENCVTILSNVKCLFIYVGQLTFN